MAQKTQALPDPNQAYEHLFDGVHAKVFLSKLASYGIQPTTDRETNDLFELAGKLRHVDNSAKQASDSRFGSALSALDSALSSTPAGHQQAAASRAQAIKQAAHSLSQDPEVYRAVLSLKAAEAALLDSNS